MNTANKHGVRPLYIGGRIEHVEVVRELLKHGSKVDKSKRTGRMFINLAAKRGYLELIRDMLK
jgi:ankyrin repeat protein